MKIPNLATLRDWCISKFQPKGDYLTSVPDEYITETKLSEKNYATSTEVADGLNEKVDKVKGKGLSTNDFTDEDKALLENIAQGAVSGVKGNAESEYRTGNVNLTVEDIGALPVDGNAASATKAEQDSDGNVITKTYAKQADLPTKVSELENDSGYATDEELKKTTELVAINKQTLGYGKKNLLKNTATTYTTNGVTYTVNNDGSVTANGTATADASINLSDFSLTNPSNSHVETLKSGNYILSGISGGSDTTYFIQYRDMTRSLSQDARDGDKVISVVNGNNVYVIIRVKAGITVNNLTFYPMIRSADIEDGTYEPYVDDVDTRIESLNTALNKAVSSSLNGRRFSTLEEFVEATNPNDISHGHMFRVKDIGGWMPLGGTSDWYACIVQYQNRYVAGSTASVDGKIDLLHSKNQHWTGYVTGNKDSGLAVTWNRVAGASDTLNTLEEISANTKEEMIAGALALKELYEQSGGVQFGYTSDGKPGYYKAGADTVTPFSASGASITGISNVENSLSRMIYTYVTFDTSSHSSLTISGVNNVDSDSLGNSVFLTITGETSSTSATLAEYTGTFSATLDVTNYDSVSLQIPATNSSLVSSEGGTIAEITSLKFE